MNHGPITAALWCGVAVVLSATALGVGAGGPWHAGRALVFPIVPGTMPGLSRDSARILAQRIAGADPFRLDRRPAAVAFRANSGTVAGAAPTPTPAKPTLSLGGIVGGPPWTAVVDGVPGRTSSTLVHPGDTVGGLHIRSVTPRSVNIVGLDTVWHLALKRPWQ